ncbi:MAG: site-specific integrase [Deltaproteobacteria bacterium]|nr:site-specific integrase [Deltaproteobacteria bacterium]
MVTKRGKKHYIYFRPFKSEKIGLAVDVPTKTEARAIETMILRACRTGDYSSLDPVSREATVRMFINQGWQLPAGLGDGQAGPLPELSLGEASERFLKSPEVRDTKQRWRHKIALLNILERLGKETPVKSLWISDLKAYREARLKEGRKPTTINRELSSLSRLFAFLVEERIVDDNPVRRLPKLSEKCSLRQVQMSKADVERIAAACPAWYAAMIWTAYYTGMRRGELLNLRRKQVNLQRRMIYLTGEDTKEGRIKRVPLRRELVSILEEAVKVPFLKTDHVFVVRDSKGVRPVHEETAKNPWGRACEKLALNKPWPRFHDLRATWKTNARRSGVHPEIERAIMGHGERGLSVHERYGFISDEELLQAVDAMTFDHVKETVVIAVTTASEEKGNKMVTSAVFQGGRF